MVEFISREQSEAITVIFYVEEANDKKGKFEIGLKEYMNHLSSLDMTSLDVMSLNTKSR